MREASGDWPGVWRRLWSAVAVSVSIAVSACGGGGGGGGGDTGGGGGVLLPATLTVNAPSTQQPLGSAVAFSASTANPGLSYLWDFGDGTTSTAVAPSHTYTRAGVFAVRLTVGNGTSILASTGSVAVADFAIVAGRACNGAGSSGWCWQRPLPQGNFILDYAFVDDSHGWAIGQGGTVLATSDGGVSWNGQRSGTTLDLGQVAFPSATAGWIVSEFGELLRTADGGANWRRVSYGSNEYVYTLGATDADRAWVVTNNGKGFVTTDGGIGWRQIARRPDTQRFAFASVSDVWSLPAFIEAQPSLEHSTDGGATWTTVNLPTIEAGFAGYSEDMLILDAAHALVTGFESGFLASDPTTFVTRRTLSLTADAGASWQTVAPPSAGASYTYRLADATTVVASNGSGLIRTQDNGATWLPIALPAGAASVNGFRAFTAQRLVLTAGDGRTYLTTDGGASWNVRGAGGVPGATLDGLWFFDSREGLALASDGSSVRTTDGGQHWLADASLPASSWRRPQFLADGSAGWAITFDKLLLSGDKGRHWTEPAAPGAVLYGVADFHFIDARRGWAVSRFSGSPSAPGAIYSSGDGGLTWQANASTAELQGFQSIRFADAMHGVAVGPSGIALASSDGGATWSPRSTGAFGILFRVSFADATTAVAVGEAGLIVRSTDAGQTWQPVSSPVTRNLNDVRFVSPLIGHAVGDNGTVIVTRDGGASWAAQVTNARLGIGAVFFLDEQTGWIAGTNGSVLATATGGR